MFEDSDLKKTPAEAHKEIKSLSVDKTKCQNSWQLLPNCEFNFSLRIF